MTSSYDQTKPIACNTLKRRTWIAFTVFAVSLTLGAISFRGLLRQEMVDEQPLILRRGLEFNEALWGKISDPKRTDPVKTPPPKGKPARVNGGIGLEKPVDLSRWKMTIVNLHGEQENEVLTVTLADLKKLPRTEIVNQFKCIEGWSEVMSFAGVKFSDFMKAYHLGLQNGASADFENFSDKMFSHVGLETPDGEYYVSVDMRSMLNPQTLLAYEMNGEPLTDAHGAPLRLVIPSKYGVKSLKRIGKLTFANTRLPDYWGEAGYDWFLGL
jgi:DMSO/TMAO reductase YedYZ molybdopterin-dependent catalytic subunit